MSRKESSLTRSKIMSTIKSSGTKIERQVRVILTELASTFEEHPGDVFGKPDFIIRPRKIAIFCDGDFWHGYNISTNPRLNVQRNRAFWLKKITANIARDIEVNRKLQSDGWQVIRLWEHDIHSHFEHCSKVIRAAMEDSN